MDTKRRHFERHKCAVEPKTMATRSDDEQEADDEEEMRTHIRPLNNSGVRSCHHGPVSQSLVTSKIGLFERLSYGAANQSGRFLRQSEIDDDDDDDDAQGPPLFYEEEAEEELGDEDDDDDELEEEFLVLDTIVEEDEELAGGDLEFELGAGVLSSTARASSQPLDKCDDKLDCDRLTKLQKRQTGNINNNVPSSASKSTSANVVDAAAAAIETLDTQAERANFAVNSRRQAELASAAAIKNNGSSMGTNTAVVEIGDEQQPPAEMRPSSSSSPSPSPTSSPDSQMPNAHREEANHKAQRHDQQVGVVCNANRELNEPVRASVEMERDEPDPLKQRLMTSTTTTTTTTSDNMTSEQPAERTTTIGQTSDNCDRMTRTTLEANAKQNDENCQQEKLVIRNKTAANNKMQYQTLLPSTNRLISEHQERQKQALFKALNERQKILDELGPDERLEQPDLMSVSCVSLNFHTVNSNSKRQWRKSTATTRRANATRARSNSVNRDERRQRANKSGGVPLSSVDLSSMTDQQVDEILGQIAPASSSSSMVSSKVSLMDELSSSSGGSSSSDDFSTSTYSTDDDDDDEDAAIEAGRQGAGQDEGQKTQLKSQMVRRLRRRPAVDGDQRTQSLANGGGSQFAADASRGRHEHQHQQLGNAPSVIGVHEDDSISVNSARRSLRSSARNCREAFKKRGKNGRSDEEDDEHGDHQGDLFVSVAGASSRGGQPASGLTGASQTGSGQCSLSPSASQSQSQAAASGNLLLASAMRNHQLASNNSGPVSHQEHNSLSCSSIVMSNSQSPTTSDEPASMSLFQLSQHQQRADLLVENTLDRMIKALKELGEHEEQHDELNELLERGFVHLEQLHSCSLSQQNFPSGSSQINHQHTPAKQQHLHQAHSPSGGGLASQPLQSQKDSDYGSDTQSNGDCFSSSNSHEQKGAIVTNGTGLASQSSIGSSSLSARAIELSLELATALRQLSQQQQARRQTQLEAAAGAMATATPVKSVAPPSHGVNMSEPIGQISQGDEQTTTTTAAAAAPQPKTRMKSVVMINSSASSRPSSSLGGETGNMTPATNLTRPSSSNQEDDQFVASFGSPPTSRPGSQQSQRQQFTTRVNLNTTNNETQIVKVISAPINSQQSSQQEPRLSRRASFRGASLRRRPSLSGSVASVHREPGAPRPGSPVPRSMLEMQQQAAESANEVKMSESNNIKSHLNRIQNEPKLQEHQDAKQQQHQLQRALILAQKYNYSPAKLATSKLSAKLNLKELIAPANNCHQGDGSSSAIEKSSAKGTGDQQNNSSRLIAGKTLLPNGNGTQQANKTNARNGQSSRNESATNFDVTGQVQLDISYFARTGSLTVHLLQCSQLAPANKRRTTSNPYIKLYLLPDRSKSGKRKSSVKKRQLEPKFDERFTFGPIQLHEFSLHTLWLSVWHKDRGLGRNVSLGELYLPLSAIRAQLLTSDQCQSIPRSWYQLTNAQKRNEDEREAPPIRRADGTLLTSKKLPAANGLPKSQATGKSPLDRADSIRRLSEFEQRAARLANQHQRLFDTESNRALADEDLFSNRFVKFTSKYADSTRIVSGVHLNLDGPGQVPPKTMQVAIGPAQSQTLGESSTISGQLFVALKFVPDSGETLAKRVSVQMSGNLHVLIKEARDIGGFKSTVKATYNSDQLPSPFCKCILLDVNGQKLAKHKTSQLRRTNSPRWDQELIFNRLKVADLQAQGLEIQLFNRDSILVSSSEHLGSIRLCKRLKEAPSMESNVAPAGCGGGGQQTNKYDQEQTIGTNLTSISSTGSLKSSISSSSTNTMNNNTADEDLCSEREARLWSQMLTRPNIWVYGELPLRQLRPIIELNLTSTTSANGQQQAGQ